MMLKAKPLLGGYDQTFGPVRLREATQLAIVSLAIPQGDEDRCNEILKGEYGVTCPESGRYVTSADGKTRILRTAPDQLFVLFDHDGADARDLVHKGTGGAFWSTDQTDNWCALDISGDDVREVLARLCPIDLHSDAFGADHAARTTMEHMGAMILRTGDDAFLLMSARSSAPSFLHAVETSLKYVI